MSKSLHALAGLTDVNVLTTKLASASGGAHRTSLDDDQLQALLACFRQQLTLIQGPPGTGTYLCSILLTNLRLAIFMQVEISMQRQVGCLVGPADGGPRTCRYDITRPSICRLSKDWPELWGPSPG